MQLCRLVRHALLLLVPATCHTPVTYPRIFLPKIAERSQLVKETQQIWPSKLFLHQKPTLMHTSGDLGMSKTSAPRTVDSR